MEPKTSFTFLSFQIVLITFHFHFLQIFELALNGGQGGHMVLDYTITIGPCLLLKALSYSNFVHSHLVSFTMHFLAIQGTVGGRPARITSYSTGGNERGVRLLLIEEKKQKSSCWQTLALKPHMGWQWKWRLNGFPPLIFNQPEFAHTFPRPKLLRTLTQSQS